MTRPVIWRCPRTGRQHLATLTDGPGRGDELRARCGLTTRGVRPAEVLARLAAMVKEVHSGLYGVSIPCSASTLRRQLVFLRSQHPEVAAALLPGLVRTNALTAEEQVGDERVSKALHEIAAQDELIEQVQPWPDQRWILADVRQNLVFVQGCATPCRCPEGLEITLACAALYRRGGDSDVVKCSALLVEMAAVFREFFGAAWEASPQTFYRRLCRLACSPHPLREYLVPAMWT